MGAAKLVRSAAEPQAEHWTGTSSLERQAELVPTAKEVQDTSWSSSPLCSAWVRLSSYARLRSRKRNTGQELLLLKDKQNWFPLQKRSRILPGHPLPFA